MSILERRFGVTLLVDTGAWYALADESERCHGRAVECLDGLAENEELVTTDAVVVETWALLCSHLGRPSALRFWTSLRENSTRIICLQSSDIEAAWHIVTGWPDQDFSFTDATTFAVMERCGLTRCFAFDAHFSVYRYGPRKDRAFTRIPAV